MAGPKMIWNTLGMREDQSRSQVICPYLEVSNLVATITRTVMLSLLQVNTVDEARSTQYSKENSSYFIWRRNETVKHSCLEKIIPIQDRTILQ